MLHERTNLLKEWDESRNFPLTPDTVSYGSKKKVWWTCENGHSWQTTVHVRSEGSGCPYCTGRKVLPGFNDLGTLYPDVAAQWDREKNGSLSPRDVSTGSKIRIWWRCPEGHSWQSPVASRTAWGHGCPVCAGKTIVTGENDLAHLQPEIAAQWDKRKNGRLSVLSTGSRCTSPEETIAFAEGRRQPIAAVSAVFREPTQKNPIKIVKEIPL